MATFVPVGPLRLLSERDVLSAARALDCAARDVPARLAAVLTAALDTVILKGETGLTADRLIASGQIEIGRPAEL